jgi:multicomponent Na+:H+ antiporter subunit C
MTEVPLSLPFLGTGLALIVIGLWSMLTHRNLIRIIVGFSLVDTGIHLVMVCIGYVTGRTAPIVDASINVADAVDRIVDPLPSALVLTAIVIGLGVTAVMLAFAVRIHARKGTLNIDECTESKW